jgi:hypothetical protein
MAAGDSSEIDVGKLVEGGFAVVTAAAGIVGGLTGGVARFVRNDSVRIYWSLGFVLLAILVALAASQIPADEADPNRDRNGICAAQMQASCPPVIGSGAAAAGPAAAGSAAAAARVCR